MRTFWSRRSVLGLFTLTGLFALFGIKLPEVVASSSVAVAKPPPLPEPSGWETPYPARWYLVTASVGLQFRMSISDLGRLVFQLNPMPGMPGHLLGAMCSMTEGQATSVSPK